MDRWDKAFYMLLSRATPRDRVMLVNMVLLCAIGTFMLTRLLLKGGPFLAYIMGWGLLSAGVYRGHQIYQIVREIRRDVPGRKSS